MNINTKIGFAFLLGVASGIFVGNMYLKEKYEKIANDEIESVKEYWEVKSNTELVDYAEEMAEDMCDQYSKEARSAAEQARNKPDIVRYAEQLHEEGYTNYSAPVKKEVPTIPEPPVEEVVEDKPDILPADLGDPYVIPPDEFGDFDDYPCNTLIYWADGILTDDNNYPVEDVESTVGSEALDTFGDYEDDSVFVRNPRLRCDFEILLDPREYEDVVQNGPRR